MGIPSATLATVQPGRSDATADDGSASGRLRGTEARQAVKDALAIVPVIITRIEPWRTDSLVPLARNLRTHSDERNSQDLWISMPR